MVYHLQGARQCQFRCLIGSSPPSRRALFVTQVSLTVLMALQDHITLADYEVHDGMGLELYYN